MSFETFLLDHGFQLSAALDPHRRSAYRRALNLAFDALGEYGEKPSVALIGFQSATLIDAVAGRTSKTYVVERDPELVEAIRQGVVARGFGKNVEILEEDPTEVAPDHRVDIAVCGLSSTWFMEGPGAQILENTKKNVLKKGGRLIPRRVVHLFELASAPTEVNGMSVRVPRYNRPGEPIPALSESKHFITSDLTEEGEVKTDIEDTIIVKPLLSGTLTGLRLTSLIELGANNVHLASHSGFQSIFVPLREEIDVEAGQPVELFIRFTMGEGLTESRFSARALQDHAPKKWEFADHEIVDRFREQIVGMVDKIDEQGRGADLDKVVSYTIDPHGDVTRLTALFWTVDEEFRKPLRELVDGFRREASKLGNPPGDEVIYDIMLETYEKARGV